MNFCKPRQPPVKVTSSESEELEVRDHVAASARGQSLSPQYHSLSQLGRGSAQSAGACCCQHKPTMCLTSRRGRRAAAVGIDDESRARRVPGTPALLLWQLVLRLMLHRPPPERCSPRLAKELQGSRDKIGLSVHLPASSYSLTDFGDEINENFDTAAHESQQLQRGSALNFHSLFFYLLLLIVSAGSRACVPPFVARRSCSEGRVHVN
ncbi:hypothetical protein EYF80_029558 [Liparis tanakae]|uniref:Uncharacterized protein n=1 Tax=Liparis tanakae TaxID=230148 RepID=A0A4Z2H566_9TELE|nr:hypothetical protein EYF80_029558 [Liparis tanakae]